MKNDLIDYLNIEISEKKLSHAFLIETDDCEKTMQDIIAIFKESKIIPNQEIDSNISLSVIRPENNLIDREKILDLQKFNMTTSVINTYKIYFIINAECMNASSYNKLLKILEEPNDNVIGFLITENESVVIPTIKSRCKRFKNFYFNVELDDNYQKFIDKILGINDYKFLDIIKFKNELLKLDKFEIVKILSVTKNELANKNNVQLANKYKILDNIIDLIKRNVNLELCLDKMIIEMRK